MNRETARSLKSQLLEGFRAQPEYMALAAADLKATPLQAPWEGLAVGLSEDSTGTRIGLRATSKAVLETAEVHSFLEEHPSDVEVEITGEIRPYQAANTARVRPLQAGWSIAHHAVTAGTLGGFASRDGLRLVLSNNHVLANTNDASAGDGIVQQGPADGGTTPADLVARLTEFVPIQSQNNLIDAAVAELEPEIDFHLAGSDLIPPTGILDQDDVSGGLRVLKIGRTTGLTTGHVSLIETDDVSVNYGGDLGSAAFDDQMEIKGDDDEAFSQPGDSGSLILTEAPPHRAVALLFAGGGGGGGGVPRTFAHPIQTVLATLGIELVYG